MYIYSVKSRVNNEIVSLWRSFFIEHHLDDLIATGCFTQYEMRQLQSDDPMSTHFVADYYFDTMDDLDRYQREYAAALKQDIVKRFAGKFHSERSIYQVISQKTK